MNAQPIFTDNRGKQFKPVVPPDVMTRSRIVMMLAIIALCPLLLVAAVTQIDLGGPQVKGVVAVANGGTGTASTLTGLVRGNSSAMTAAELSGDISTSGSNAATVNKINGTSITTNSAADQTIITTASATAAYKTIPDCPTGALEYTQSTHAFSCGTVLTGTFADAETPSGTINSSNVTFTLAHTPSPAGSLACYLNGVEQRAGSNDYSLSTATITYGTAPATGSSLICYYRY